MDLINTAEADASVEDKGGFEAVAAKNRLTGHNEVHPTCQREINRLSL